MENEFAELLDSLAQADLVCIAATFMDEEQLKRALIDSLCDGFKENVLEHHRYKKG